MTALRGRGPRDLRPVEIIPDYTKWAEGSVLCCFGDTKVLCNATLEDRVPPWLKDRRPAQGWVTGEYAMLPRSTDRRNRRESTAGKIGGRTHEISRLVGRALRGSVDLVALGQRQITVDCDVIQADGGTRTASITGAWVAMQLAVRRAKGVSASAVKRQVAAVSLGVVDGEVVLDLDYSEDVDADTDLNLVMTDDGGIIEVQGTAEGAVLKREELDAMLDLGRDAMSKLFEAQRQALERAR